MWRASRAARAWRLQFRVCIQRSAASSSSGKPSNFLSISTATFRSKLHHHPQHVRSFAQQAQMREDIAAEDHRFSALCRSLELRPDSLQVIKDWAAQGNDLSHETLSRLYTWMDEKRMFVQALKILTGIREEKLAEISLSDYLMEIDLVCRQHGCAKGEALYQSLPEEMRSDDRVKSHLILSFTKQLTVSKVEKWMQLFNLVDAEPWNGVLEMYLSRDKHDKVFATYKKMEEAGIELTVDSYHTLLKCKDRVGGYPEIGNDAEECLQKTDIRRVELSTLKRMMEVYGHLKAAEAVESIWKALKERFQDPDEDCYVAAIRSFGLAGDLLKAEEVLKDQLVSTKQKLCQSPYVAMIEVYARLGFMDKAEEVLKKNITKNANEPDFSPYDFIIAGYIAKEEPVCALQRYQEGLTSRSKLQYKTVVDLLGVFAKRRDVDAAEKLMLHYQSYHGDTNLYNQLLRIYVAAIRIPKDLKKRMQSQFVETNDETEALLKRLPVYSPTGNR